MTLLIASHLTWMCRRAHFNLLIHKIYRLDLREGTAGKGNERQATARSSSHSSAMVSAVAVSHESRRTPRHLLPLRMPAVRKAPARMHIPHLSLMTRSLLSMLYMSTLTPGKRGTRQTLAATSPSQGNRGRSRRRAKIHDLDPGIASRTAAAMVGGRQGWCRVFSSRMDQKVVV